jgi:hypothetical protein
MKSAWLTVLVVVTVPFLRMTQANSEEPDRVPILAADSMIGKEPRQVRDDNGLMTKIVWYPS